MAEAVIRARTDLDTAGFQSGVTRMQAGAAQIKGLIAGAFSTGAVVAFGKSSIDAMARLQDFADQFALSASEARGFVRAISEVGGNAEKAEGILRKLQEAQVKLSDPRTLSQFIDSIKETYDRTNDLGQIIDLVGSKNASTFAAALREMSGGMQSFRDDTLDATAALSDFYQEQIGRAADDARSKFATLIAATISGWRNVIAFAKGGFDGMMEEQYRQDRELQQFEKRRIDRQKAEADARARAQFEGAFSELAKAKQYQREAELGSGSALYKLKPMKQQSGAPIMPESVFQIPRFDDLRRIGAGIIGGKSVNELRDLYRTAEKQLKVQEDIAEATSETAQNTRGGLGTFTA